MATVLKYTQEGFEKLKQEYEFRAKEERERIKVAIAEARSFGDLSENAEYDEARNEQAKNEARIKELEELIQHAVVVENVANAILNGEELISPLEEGIKGLELGNAMLLSGLKDKTVELPIDAEEFAVEIEKLIATSRYTKNVKKLANTDDFGNSF